MKIAAQQNGNDVQIFIEESGWMKTTLPLNKELVKIDLVVFMKDDDSIFHDAISHSEPVTDTSLMFCLDNLTVATFKQKLKKAGFGEPYEVRLSNKLFALEKQFTDAYSLTFNDYKNNQAFTDWLSFLPSLEAGFLLQRIHQGRPYGSRGFSEFREFPDLKRFTEHRFEIWHDAVVKEFEQAQPNGTAHCPGCGEPDVALGAAGGSSIQVS